MKKIGIIGLGMLGNAVALHLADSGFEVTAYNRTKEKNTRSKPCLDRGLEFLGGFL